MRDENKINLSSSLFVAKTTLVTSKRLNYTMMLITSMIQSFVGYTISKMLFFLFSELRAIFQPTTLKIVYLTCLTTK